MSLSIMLADPVREPFAVGANTTFTAQDPPGASEVGQLLVWEKSPATAIGPIISNAFPGFLTVTICGWLRVPTIWPVKVSL